VHTNTEEKYGILPSELIPEIMGSMMGKKLIKK
jgi:hypothetical protein